MIYANLIFENLGLSKSEEEKRINHNEIRHICIKTELPKEENIKLLLSNIKYDKEYCQNFINDLQTKIIRYSPMKSLKEIHLKEIHFMKDNINNSQFDFIYACSNLRAINF